MTQHVNEIWRPVVGFEDYYEVSDQGRVRSLPRTCRCSYGTTRKVKLRILKPQRGSRTRGGIGAHVHVSLSIDGIIAQRRVHTLVLEAFRGLRPQGTETRHLNGIPNDNRLLNLSWGTPKENRADTLRHGTLPRGVRKPNAKLNNVDIPVIRAALNESNKGITALARRYGVTRSTIEQILKGRSWTHV